MRKPRPTSIVILITLAELAWLAAFGLLFAYWGKVVELRVAKEEYRSATNKLSQANSVLTLTTKELTWWRTNASDIAELRVELESVKKDKARLQADLNAIALAGTNMTAQLAKALERARVAEGLVDNLTNELAQINGAKKKIETQLKTTTRDLAELRLKWDTLPPNPGELANLLREATNMVASLETRLREAMSEIARLKELNAKLKEGEIAIRRELIGLPAKPLQRVVFVVDTSSSMRNDTNVWKNSKKLMQTWLEHLAVQECVLVNFNSSASSYPTNKFLQVREPGTNNLLTNHMTALLGEFERVQGGDFTDILMGLSKAHQQSPKADLIVLFTDGRPNVQNKTERSFRKESLRATTSELRDIPILAVAVGKYDREGVVFLKDLAQNTGGSFIGR